MLATTGLCFSSRARTSSRQMRSEAVPSPPGESMRTTMARTAGSSASAWMRRAMLSDPAISTPPKGEEPPEPRAMSPSTRTMPMRGLGAQRSSRTEGCSSDVLRRNAELPPKTLRTSSSS